MCVARETITVRDNSIETTATIRGGELKRSRSHGVSVGPVSRMAPEVVKQRMLENRN